MDLVTEHSPRSPSVSWKTRLEVVTTVAMLVASLTMIAAFFKGADVVPRELTVPAEPLDLTDAAVLGSRAAPVALLIFSDFECPFCGTFARETFPAIEEEYVEKGRVLVAFRHFPLKIHTFAERAAAGAECARRQGKFWAAHDRLFEKGSGLLRDLSSWPAVLGLDVVEFDACTATAASRVQKDLDLALQMKMTGTPTFVLGRLKSDMTLLATQVITGARPFGEFKAAMDGLLPKAGT